MSLQKGLERLYWKIFEPKDNKKIAEKINQAEKIPNLSAEEKLLLEFLKTQLEVDWETPCLNMLDEMIKGKNLSPKERGENITKRLKKRKPESEEEK